MDKGLVPNAMATQNAKANKREGEFQRICTDLGAVSNRADEIRGLAREIEHRLLGPQPEDEEKDLGVPISSSNLNGLVTSATAAVRRSLNDIAESLNRIHRELGTIGHSNTGSGSGL